MMLKLLAPLSLALCIAAVILTASVHRTYGTRLQISDTRRIRTLVQGNGSPTVVFEQFGLAPLEAWSTVQPEVAKFTRTFTYDHAGYWGSDPGPTPRDAHAIAADLHHTLESANIHPPYILVGHSFGGPLIRVFAHTYPHDVAAMVLVDPTQEESIWYLQKHYPEINRIDEKDIIAGSEFGCSNQSLQQAHAAMPLPPVPITLITAMHHPDIPARLRAFIPTWRDNHRRWLAQFPRSRHVILHRSGHGVPIDDPDSVIAEIRRVVELARPSSAKETRR